MTTNALSTPDRLPGAGASTSALAPGASSVRGDGMGRDAFLQLLVTQLQHQDPTQPQADGEFLAQLAQFSSLEQLTGMQTTLRQIAAALGVESSSQQ